MKIPQTLIGSIAAGILLSSASLLAAPSRDAGVTLRVDPATTLPGLPVAFLVTLPEEVIERGLNEVNAVLHVTPNSGETFQALFSTDDPVQGRTVGWINFHLRSLASRGMIEVQQPVDPPWGPDWFADHRLHEPGTYRLRLQILATELGMPADLWSSEAILEVRQPAGPDAQAWEWLRTQGWKWEKWSPESGRQLVDKFPSSGYARYGIGMLTRQDGDAAVPWIHKAIELAGGTWLADHYRILQQGRRVEKCHEAASSGASRSEVRQCMIRVSLDVREKIRLIATQTSSPAIRHKAEAGQRHLKEEADDMSAIKE